MPLLLKPPWLRDDGQTQFCHPSDPVPAMTLTRKRRFAKLTLAKIKVLSFDPAEYLEAAVGKIGQFAYRTPYLFALLRTPVRHRMRLMRSASTRHCTGQNHRIGWA